MKARNNCPVRYNFGDYVLIFTVPFLGHKNDNEAVVCSIEPRRYMESSEKCYNGFSGILRQFYGFSEIFWRFYGFW